MHVVTQAFAISIVVNWFGGMNVCINCSAHFSATRDCVCMQCPGCGSLYVFMYIALVW